MKNVILQTYSSIMDNRMNPLRNLPMPAQHYYMQALAWMWSMVFSLSFLSIYQFHVVWVAHVLFLVGVFLTVSVFKHADKQQKKRINKVAMRN